MPIHHTGGVPFFVRGGTPWKAAWYPPHLSHRLRSPYSLGHEILFQVDNKEELEDKWRVILHNDEIHTFAYVTQSITKASLTLLLLRAAGGDIGYGHYLPGREGFTLWL